MSILHSVFFYFKDDISASEIERQRVAILEDLSRIATVDTIWAGAPLGVDRAVVDNTYGMSLHLMAADRKALEAYQADPIHQDFLADFKDNWTGVKIYDTVVG